MNREKSWSCWKVIDQFIVNFLFLVFWYATWQAWKLRTLNSLEPTAVRMHCPQSVRNSLRVEETQIQDRGGFQIAVKLWMSAMFENFSLCVSAFKRMLQQIASAFPYRNKQDRSDILFLVISATKSCSLRSRNVRGHENIQHVAIDNSESTHQRCDSDGGQSCQSKAYRTIYSQDCCSVLLK